MTRCTVAVRSFIVAELLQDAAALLAALTSGTASATATATASAQGILDSLVAPTSAYAQVSKSFSVPMEQYRSLVSWL